MQKTNPGTSFFNIYSHNFIRAAVAVPGLKVADPAFNAARTIDLMREAASKSCILVVFPELGLTAYTCDDLFHQRALLEAALVALERVRDASRNIPVISIVGLPLMVDSHLFNCAVMVSGGTILGVVPKSYLPNYREFYELRHFAPEGTLPRESIAVCGQKEIPFGSSLLFQMEEQPLFTIHVEICEDLWTPIPPSSYGALAGATVLANLSASNITVAKADYRRQLASSQSARCIAAYLYTAAGTGESTTDMAWDGHGMIYENGSLLSETGRFVYRPQIAYSDIDLDRLIQDRMRQNTFSQAASRHRDEISKFRTVQFSAPLPARGVLLPVRACERFPYVPSHISKRDERCREIYEIQVQGLVKRLKATGIGRIVIGVSGGLDSTHALLVCAKALDIMGLPRERLLAYTMPGFATGERTLNQARELMDALGCFAQEIDIKPSCLQMLKDIKHPFAEGKPLHDITFENVQAGERTSHLFRLANLHGALVVGTSDLSELALGWCTYGVGDHMAHYHINAGIPKTLIRYLIAWVAEKGQLGDTVREVLRRVIETEISPELVPGLIGDQPAQRTEDIIGPYELQDFNLYYILRFGYSPSKVAFLAWWAWGDKTRGPWPGTDEEKRNQYSIGEIKRWLRIFLTRFFKSSQYKRSCAPNSPKVGSGGSLSPRGDYRAPSDSEAAVWITQLDHIPDQTPPILPIVS
ncbi:MAG: NAD(+) synthase [Desulfobacteraceae bacterium]|nr:MAG: NAD(+) synthase [Desulfobacteraceae bacterium]